MYNKKKSKKIAAVMTLIIVLVLSFVSGCDFGTESNFVNVLGPTEGATTAEATASPLVEATPATHTEDANSTKMPTAEPTLVPTHEPTQAPTHEPTQAPTHEPTLAPTQAPTQEPTLIPTQDPTQESTLVPTQAPTKAPTQAPTQAPTKAPTQAPTKAPTQAPTKAPTQAPTKAPTQAPTKAPTQAPTKAPTQAPTKAPTQAPTKAPTQAPTQAPTLAPTQTPVPKPLSPIKESDYFGRKWLSKQKNSDNLLWLYDTFATSSQAMKTEVSMENKKISTDEFIAVWHVYLNDYPQHFWVNKEVGYRYDSQSNVVSFNMSYLMSKSDRDVAVQKFNNSVNAILAKLDGNMSQYDLEKIIHDELILLVTYDMTNITFCHTAYGALVQNRAVCDGYAQSFEYICRLAGIQAYIVEGKAVNNANGQYENHAWNVVMLDGNYCLVDVTWDDANEPEREYIHYKYFNVTTEEMNEDHIPDEYDFLSPEIPTCTTTKYNYYIQHNSIFKTLDATKIASTAVRFSNLCVCQFEYIGSENVVQWIQNNISGILGALKISNVDIKLVYFANEYTLIFISR